MNTLLLYLAGPMQSWGHRSRFDDRDTGLEPTRSGVIGLLCCALGRPRDADLSQFSEMRLGVRVDAPGVPRVDYHTAMTVSRANGGMAETVVSKRHYLADARFVVGVQHVDLQQLYDWEAALRNPRWPLYLGRKSFVPAIPVCWPQQSVLIGMDAEMALRATPWFRLFAREEMPDRLRLIVETDNPREGTARTDVPRDFARRIFANRYIKHFYLRDDEIIEGEVWPCTYPA